MKEKLKLYIGNYGAKRKAAIITTSKKMAAKIANISFYQINHYWDVIYEDLPFSLEPHQLYTKPYRWANRGWDTEWTKGICEFKVICEKDV